MRKKGRPSFAREQVCFGELSFVLPLLQISRAHFPLWKPMKRKEKEKVWKERYKDGQKSFTT